MEKRILFFLIAMALFVVSCKDDDSFTNSTSARLSFGTDTVRLDTVFSTIPSSTRTFWVYNHNGDGVRIRQVRLVRGNQTGFRVNVDGLYLDNTQGSFVNDLELRKGDSLRVFVEITSSKTGNKHPTLVEDDLAFVLESGVEQRIRLTAYSWDATFIHNLKVKQDTTIMSDLPLVVYGDITVDTLATLTLKNPTKLYFHRGSGINVYGRLVADSVEMRGDRLDNMFSYLPYDRVSGQWKGIRLFGSSQNNVITDCNIHSAEYGVVVDSAALDTLQPRLLMSYTTIHNCKGPGLTAQQSNVALFNCQMSNTLDDCVSIYGGMATIIYCTLAQFYPLSANRGAALRFTNFIGETASPLVGLYCQNTLITGYADDVIMGESRDTTAYNYYFENCLLRTPEITDTTLLKAFSNCIWEKPSDDIQGTKHFKTMMEREMLYDFHLDSLSTAKGRGVFLPYVNDDHDHYLRNDSLPSIGCYEYR